MTSAAGSAAPPPQRSRPRARADVIASSAGRDPARVLIVDDNRDFAENLAEMSRLSGLSATVCATCAEARASIERQGFDVAIVDQRLPDGFGIDLLAELRQRCADIVTIVVTAFVSLDH